MSMSLILTPQPTDKNRTMASLDGSATVHVAHGKPAMVSGGNWIQTDPAMSWNTIPRPFSPLEPFFAMTWRPAEFELVG
jgi:hypothetical protein